MSNPNQEFRFFVGEAVRHCEDDRTTYTVTRRWLDVDAPAEKSRWYDLRDNKPLFHQTKVGPVSESSLSLPYNREKITR